MNHTPEQAAALWCPMVRIARDESIKTHTPDGFTREQRSIVAGCNTDALGGLRVPASCRCIADKCAMWRWQAEAILVGEKRGYCGLAGRPEVL